MAVRPKQEPLKRIVRAEHMARCLELRRQGWNLQQIADELGISRSSAGNLAQQAIESIAQPEIERHRALIQLRLEHLLRRVEILISKDKPDVKAITEARNLCAELAKLAGLYPKDEPPQVNVAIKVVGVDMDLFLGRKPAEGELDGGNVIMTNATQLQLVGPAE